MPQDTVFVRTIWKHDTVKPGVHLYIVNADDVETGRLEQYQTVNAWLASLCQRAKDETRRATITWDRTKYGRTIRRVA